MKNLFLRIFHKCREKPIAAAIIIASLAVISFSGVMTAKYGIALIRMKSVGVSLKPAIVIPPRDVTYYLQNDPLWASDSLGATNSTMGGEGCLVASITTALCYHGYDFTPKEVNNLFNERGVFTESGKVIWMNIKNAVPDIDYKYDRVFDARTIEKLLLDGMLPIIEVKMRGVGMNHWVAVIGSDGTDFLVMDPLNQSKTPVKLSDHGGRAYAYRVLVRK